MTPHSLAAFPRRTITRSVEARIDTRYPGRRFDYYIWGVDGLRTLPTASSQVAQFSSPRVARQDGDLMSDYGS